MRICVVKATNKLLEMQSDATPGTLIQNAVNAGFNVTDIEEREVTEEEYKLILNSQPKLPQAPTLDERMASAEAAILALMGV